MHEHTLTFIDNTGAELDSVTCTEGIIKAEQAFIQTASQCPVTSVQLGAYPGHRDHSKHAIVIARYCRLITMPRNG